jgi:hypothetical protein
MSASKWISFQAKKKRLQLPSEIKSTVMASLAGSQYKRTEGITAGKFLVGNREEERIWSSRCRLRKTELGASPSPSVSLFSFETSGTVLFERKLGWHIVERSSSSARILNLAEVTVRALMIWWIAYYSGDGQM